MNKNLLIVAAIAVIILAAGGLFLYTKKGNNTVVTNPTLQPTPTQTASAAPETASPSASSEANNSKTVNVTLTDQGFVPSSLTITKGTKVVWTNKSGATATVNSDPHPIHTNYPPLNLNQFVNGETLSLIFNDTGTYGYHNHLNPSQKGTIIVK